jgi:biopolymer transport protein ExbB
MSKNKTISGFNSLMSVLSIVVCLVVGVLIYTYVFGAPENFDAEGEPVPLVEGEEVGWSENVPHYLGTIYKGGFIVPILVAINLIIILFSVERFVTLSLARGKGKSDKFVAKIKSMLENKEIDSAIEACDKQKGSLANVVRSGLVKYDHIKNDSESNKEQKVETLKKELEEASALELPMLSKNMVVLSTCASIATLIGLIGTVLGMIRSFAAMSGGAPDTSELATGISEALINTFFGIAGSTIAIIMFNFFSTKIDAMTYSIDEASFTIVQDFSASQK